MSAKLESASPEVHAELQKNCQAMADAVGTRDWAGFFAALAAFAQQIIPLIVPFLKPAA